MSVFISFLKNYRILINNISKEFGSIWGKGNPGKSDCVFRHLAFIKCLFIFVRCLLLKYVDEKNYISVSSIIWKKM